MGCSFHIGLDAIESAMSKTQNSSEGGCSFHIGAQGDDVEVADGCTVHIGLDTISSAMKSDSSIEGGCGFHIGAETIKSMADKETS